MSNLIWSIALAALGIIGIWRAGSGRRDGWLIGLTAQVAWIVFALVSGQLGFIASALAYGFVYGRNLWRARRATLVPPPGSCGRPPAGWYCSLSAGHDGPCPTRRLP